MLCLFVYFLVEANSCSILN